ncbi:MAG: prenyltransferase/squalene oxidase repeat-containing protein, partial [Planctomycetota bacterium]
MSFDPAALQNTHERARARLLEQFTELGSCQGELSSSALSTATASMAFALSQRAAESRNKNNQEHQQLAADGHRWLGNNQNQDGGWGDTSHSPSNISTTTLCWASLSLAEDQATARTALDRAEAWLKKACGELDPDRLTETIKRRYGKDQTFSAPILMTCALADKLGDEGWNLVPSLPFELAACPHQIFPLLQLRMVSYALPALIALGQVRHFHLPSKNPIARIARRVTQRRTLRILEKIQPTSGGFLEAAPLTSFVAMAMISMDRDEHAVTNNCLRFLQETVRADGCWPIDTNLDTWTTTLAVNALSPELEQVPQEKTRTWLLGQQYLTEHPYTHAAPGGWAWTDLPGGVPDADDTAGALLAIRALFDADPQAERMSLVDSAANGIRWLLGIQNMDGGMPTFCKGWGKLPFDRSSPDLSAHAMRAFHVWRRSVDPGLGEKLVKGRDSMAAYLLETQRDDGAWVPLWFGNQHEELEENPLYGTSRVLLAIAEVRLDGDQD